MTPMKFGEDWEYGDMAVEDIMMENGEYIKCEHCDGEGERQLANGEWYRCEYCNGKGIIFVEKKEVSDEKTD